MHTCTAQTSVREKGVMKMQMDDNKDAYNAMRNMINSMENKSRSLYNYGYKDGFKDGVEAATREIVEKIIADKEGEQNE